MIKLPRKLYIFFLQLADKRKMRVYDIYFEALCEYAVKHGFKCNHSELRGDGILRNGVEYRKCRECGMWVPVTRVIPKRELEEEKKLLSDMRTYTHIKDPKALKDMGIPIVEEDD